MAQLLTYVTIYAASGSSQDIQAAVDSAAQAGGGTVVVPYGTFTFNIDLTRTRVNNGYAGVAITGGINVVGSDTVLYCPLTGWNYDLRASQSLFLLDGRNNQPIRITGITFKGSVNTAVGADDDRTLNAIAEFGVRDFRIDHCNFVDFCSSAIGTSNNYVHNPTGNCGVIDHCNFDNPYKDTFRAQTGTMPLWGYGVVIVGDYPNWMNYLDCYGKYAHDIVFIEDCSFNRCRHSVSGGQEGMGFYVLRHCQLNDMVPAGYGSYQDAHSGTVGCECYENTINNTPYDARTGDGNLGYLGIGFYMRGGAALIYHNTINNFNGNGTQDAITLVNLDANPRYRVQGTYIWENTFNNCAVQLDVLQQNFPITVDTHYFLRQPTQAQDGFTYSPYAYPHPLTILSSMTTPLAYCNDINETTWNGMQSGWYINPATHHAELSVVADGAVLPNGQTLTTWKTANGISGGRCILTRPPVDNTATGDRWVYGEYNLLDWFGQTIDLTANALLKIRFYTNHPEVPVNFIIWTSPWTQFSYNTPALSANAWNEVAYDLRLDALGAVPDLTLFRTIGITLGETAVIPQEVANEYFMLVDYITVEPATAQIPLQANISPKSARLKTAQTSAITCTAAGGTGNYTFKWYLNGALTNTTTPTYMFVAGNAGTYNLHATVMDGVQTVTTGDTTITVIPQLPPPVPARPLHCSGKYILDDTNKKFRFTGTDTVCGFLDRPIGIFIGEDGTIPWSNTTFTQQLPYIQQYIDGMRSWGFNSTRDHLAVEFWIQNTEGFRDNLRTYLQMLVSNGLTPIIDFYSIQGAANARGGGVPLPKYMTSQELAITGWTTPQDFANFWGSAAAYYKDLPVIFDIWNEPAYDANNNAIAEQTLWADWFPAVQLAINAIRATGATNPIIIEVGMGPDWEMGSDTGHTLDWITQYPLNDPLGNLIYSSHIYRSFTAVGWWYLGSGIWSFDTRAAAYTHSDIDHAWTKMKYPEILAQYPFVVGEIGVADDGSIPPLLYDKLNSMPRGGTDAERIQAEYDADRYIFQKLANAEVGWLTWWFRSSVGFFSLLQAGINYPPTAGGTIIQEVLASTSPTPFNWLPFALAGAGAAAIYYLGVKK